MLIDAFELWCWRRLLRVPWTARRSNQSILKEISPGCSLEGMMLKLKLQYFGHLMGRVESLEKTLMLGGIGGRRRRGQQKMSGWIASPTRWTWVWVNSGSWWCTGRPGVLRFMGSQRVGHDWVTELNWTDTSIWVSVFKSLWYIPRSGTARSYGNSVWTELESDWAGGSKHTLWMDDKGGHASARQATNYMMPHLPSSQGQCCVSHQGDNHMDGFLASLEEWCCATLYGMHPFPISFPSPEHPRSFQRLVSIPLPTSLCLKEPEQEQIHVYV